MAKLKSKASEEVVKEEVKETPINENEVEAVAKDEKAKEESGANTERLRLATNLVSGQFNLDDTYHVSKFDDKGKVVNLTLENKEFCIAVTIKDSDRHGMVTE